MSCCNDRSGKGAGRRYGRGWSWVHSGGRNCRTTVLSPEGADTASLGSARCVGYQFRPATNGHGRSSEGDALYRTTPSLALVARSGGIASMLGRSAS